MRVVFTEVAVMTLHKKPVNSLSLELLTEIRTGLEELHANKNCQGLILTSVGLQLTTCIAKSGICLVKCVC